ncbi:exonuclease V a 5' deoxyribonuclease-domain-containing protein [Irpex rosettiformis]|uniref:Exonuclease V a 5' deoxyribonuclease-domain-containing protein n=1 Tax=Irpex rosettiformis TaxID=378272 RepID=A0ACB8UIX0_9APHY|nr:exonuclease V a 5' deoxyribonuclease-domain-containing protein [Irpex rosettiformis]
MLNTYRTLQTSHLPRSPRCLATTTTNFQPIHRLLRHHVPSTLMQLPISSLLLTALSPSIPHTTCQSLRLTSCRLSRRLLSSAIVVGTPYAKQAKVVSALEVEERKERKVVGGVKGKKVVKEKKEGMKAVREAGEKKVVTVRKEVKKKEEERDTGKQSLWRYGSKGPIAFPDPSRFQVTVKDVKMEKLDEGGKEVVKGKGKGGKFVKEKVVEMVKPKLMPKPKPKPKVKMKMKVKVKAREKIEVKEEAKVKAKAEGGKEEKVKERVHVKVTREVEAKAYIGKPPRSTPSLKSPFPRPVYSSGLPALHDGPVWAEDRKIETKKKDRPIQSDGEKGIGEKDAAHPSPVSKKGKKSDLFSVTVEEDEKMEEEEREKEKEKERQAKLAEIKKQRQASWRSRMNRWDWFRVTDLIAPVWCEYQFEYRYLQTVTEEQDKKAKREHKDEIVTKAGKKVQIDRQRDQKQAQLKKAGTSIHRVLELAVHPEEEKPVQVTTAEDRWGLSLVRMINSVHSLVENGVCREMPVFGLARGELVRGVIDEVVREPLITTSTIYDTQNKRKRTRGMTSLPSTPTKPRKPPKLSKNQSPSQTLITESFSPVKPTSTPTPRLPEPQFHLMISDTKSRMHPCIPPDSDTLGGRLQLMVYHHLLSALVAPRGTPLALNFTKIWKMGKVVSTKEFSEKFREDAALPDEVKCLDDLVAMWYNVVEMLSVKRVSSRLSIEWRVLESRLYPKRWEGGKKGGDEDEAEVAEVLKMLDEKVKSSQARSLPLQGPEVEEITKDEIVDGVGVKGVQKGKKKAKGKGKGKGKSVESSSSDSDEDLGQHKSVKFGTTEFEQDSQQLNDHLRDILMLWNGQRQPRGVDVTLTRRCDTCAYKFGCEWREQKAAEAVEKVVSFHDPLAGSVPGLGLPTYADQSAVSSSARPGRLSAFN